MSVLQKNSLLSDFGAAPAANALALTQELAWFEFFLGKRTEQFRQALEQANRGSQGVSRAFLESVYPPPLTPQTPYGRLVQALAQDGRHYHSPGNQALMHLAERLILVLTLVPHVRPEALDVFFYPNAQNRDFTEFGGVKAKTHTGFLPTGETAMFILSGDNLELRFQFQAIFEKAHFFARTNILRLVAPGNNEPVLSGPLEISREYLQLLTTGKPYQPDYSLDFPAQRLQTKLDWDDLVLDYYTQRDVDEVRAWIKHRETIQQDPLFSRELTGYRALFYGPSGTGKTLTTTLLGKEMGMEVYRIDLSKVVSKYIGETEKNLAHVFNQAAYHDWILFFDEGDALFGKRTQTKTSNDRHANQEVAYLLQQIEDHPGIIILATNVRSNMDRAFLRRFQTEVFFPIPDETSRLLLWQKAFQGRFTLETSIDLADIARRYDLTGAAIKNVKHYCQIMALDRHSDFILAEDFREGLRKQLDKEGRKL